MPPEQLPLFPIPAARPFNIPFPSTRYQGSKRTLIDWIWEHVYNLPFNTVLDVFGGTGVVSHMFKNAGKQVTYNDLLAFNWNFGVALVENRDQRLSDEEIDLLVLAQPSVDYPDFIHKNFKGIYFTDEENIWLDRVAHNIDHLLTSPYKQALARFALFQACIIKRPYNLFHRANLYMRTAQVERSFGNKISWDKPFEAHFRRFTSEANAAVFDNGHANRAIRRDALETPIGADLVYFDPPYLNTKGMGVNYRDFYHFLEGLSDYANWHQHIDYDSKHRRLRPQDSVWHHATTITDAFEQLITRHRDSILVISYRDDGIPSKETLKQLLLHHKKHLNEAAQTKHYALAHKKTRELLLIAPW